MRHTALASLFIVFFLLASCQMTDNSPVKSSTGSDAEASPQFTQFTDIPVPDKATMNLNKSILFGMQEEWLGRLVFTTPYTVNNVFDFYVAEMRRFGWNNVTTVRMTSSTMTFARDQRIATFVLTPYTGGTEVVLTVSPRETLNAKTVKKAVTTITSQTKAPGAQTISSAKK